MAKRKNGEGSYGEKIIKGVTYKYFRDENGKYVYAKTQKELREKIKAKKENRIQENIKTYKLCTFGEYCDVWLKTVANDITYGTYDDYESIIKCRIKNFKGYDIGNKQVKALNEKMFNDYFNALGKKYSRGSIDKVWTIVRQVLDYGFEEGDIPEFNRKKIKLPKEESVAVKKKEIPLLTLDDIELIYKEANRLTSRNTLFYGNASKVVVFIMYSGVRLGEAIGLTWKNVSKDFSSINITQSNRKIIERDENNNAIKNDDGTNKYIRIQKTTKSKSGIRSIPLPNRAQEILKYFYENYSHELNDFVFVTGNGTPYEKRAIERCLERILTRSECKRKDCTPHTLRHAYGSILISKGVDIKIVSELLGHSDVAFTYNVYISILKSDKINAIQNVFNKRDENEIKNIEN